MKRVLVITPHPDDEAIGCGGTLRKHVTEGDAVHVIFLTSGEKGGHGRSEPETIRLREREARDAGHILGLERLEFYHEPDGGLRASRAPVNRLRARVGAWKPDIIYVPHDREMHPDHRAAVRIVRQALNGAGDPRTRPRVLMFEVWTPLQRIDEIVDISPYVEVKTAAIRAYESQCAAMSFDDAMLGLNRYRGEMHSWPGGPYAEIFAELRA
jgi:LmbE family N-acetylglucosaminyl deacetylase